MKLVIGLIPAPEEKKNKGLVSKEKKCGAVSVGSRKKCLVFSTEGIR